MLRKVILLAAGLAALSVPPALACSIACPGAELALSAPTFELVDGEATATPPSFPAGTIAYSAEGTPTRIVLDDGREIALSVQP